MNKISFKTHILPLFLAGGVIVADQVSKYFVAALIKPGQVAYSLFGDFFWLVHHKNTGVAFSMGYNFPDIARVVLFIVLPVIILCALLVYYFRTREFSTLQRWAVCGILGGGFGNILDRIFRPDGVVDFASFKFYGLFGMERWPTFNVADSAVVVCGIIIIATTFLAKPAASKK